LRKKDNKENKMQTPLVEEAPPVGIERSTAFEISNLKEKQNKGSNENRTPLAFIFFC